MTNNHLMLREFKEICTLVTCTLSSIYSSYFHTDITIQQNKYETYWQVGKDDCKVNKLELDDIRMAKFSEMQNVSLVGIVNFLDSDLLTVKSSQEHCTLSSAAQPTQVGYLLKWDFPAA